LCGIFGYITKQPISLNKVFQVLERLETSQYPNETTPLGGYGAGIAIMLRDGVVISEKVGKTNGSPVRQLRELIKNQLVMGERLTEASVLLGHVRYPTSQFLNAALNKESAQPYVEHFQRDVDAVSPGESYVVASAHNGFVKNYLALKKKLGSHVFESEKVGLVDSEVIPHYYGEVLNEVRDVDEALYQVLADLQGSNCVALLHVDKEDAFIHLLHKGKTRGLIVWTNSKGEVIFSTQREPVEEIYATLLTNRGFKEKTIINPQEDAGLKLSFPALFQ
jgi:glucosamine 6-phosphate synthetase-like amidotransferase/phosphosugar isomerase protein